MMPVLVEALAVQTRLEEIGVSVADLIAIARSAVGARRSATLDHPATAAGLLSWIEGTGTMRNALGHKGWQRSRENGIESVYNPESGVRIAFQNADRAGDEHHDPLATSDKGPASAHYVASNQGELFPEIAKAEERRANAACYYLFVQAIGDDVRVELSFPCAIEDRQFLGFHERIIIVGPGGWDMVELPDDEVGPDFDVDVTRRAE